MKAQQLHPPAKLYLHPVPVALSTASSSIGERLEQVLRARNICKISPLAMELGVNESCVSRWRRGGAISTGNAIGLCRALDVSLDWFLSGRGHMDQHKKRAVSDREYALIETLRLLPESATQNLVSLLEPLKSSR